MFIPALIEAKKEIKILLQDKINLYSKTLKLDNDNILELIKAEDEYQEMEREILDLENQYNYAKEILGNNKGLKDNSKVKINNIIAIEDIEKFIVKNSKLDISLHPKLKLLKAKKDIDILKKDIEVSNSKFSLAYIQAKYAGDPNDKFKKKFSLGIGFDIPFRNSNNIKVAEEALNIYDSENDYFQELNRIEEKLKYTRNLLLSELNKYKLIQRQIKNEKVENTIKKHQEYAAASPQVLLTLKEIVLNKTVMSKALKTEIMKLYIDCLDQTNLLIKQPYVNYLSANLATLKVN